MALGPEEEKALSRQARLVALVIAGAMLIWLGAQWAGPKLGIAGNYAILIDLAVLAAFIWSFVVTYRIWRRRQDN